MSELGRHWNFAVQLSIPVRGDRYVFARVTKWCLNKWLYYCGVGCVTDFQVYSRLPIRSTMHLAE